MAYPQVSVVKPVDDSGSYGVRLCANLQEVADHAKALFAWSVNEVGQPKIPTVLVEEYVRGPEVSVEVIVADSHPRIIAITDKMVLAPPSSTRLVTPSRRASTPRLATGYDMHAALLDIHLGTDPGAPTLPHRGATIMFLPSPGGRIRKIHGVEAARSMAHVVDVGMFVEPGVVLPEEAAGYDRLGYAIAVAPDGPAAASAAQDAVGAIQVDVETVPAI